MHFPSLAIVLSSVAALASAAPSASCKLADVQVPLNGSLVAPTGSLEFVALGVGTQNYSCSAAGTFSSIGALATLYDASCFVNLVSVVTSKFTGSCEFGIAALQGALGRKPVVLGHHYFINNPTGAAGVSPVFDFRADSEKGNPSAFVTLSKTGDVPAPVNPATNVDWLDLTAIPGQGSLASQVYRVTTIGGQPPKTCTPGSAPITVPYAATYCEFLPVKS
ncbi:hypothetical protein M422DRAFT_152275 [Sphaerobolus stellatus SS14]|nr:hypothetical protein M422DRAFT_152275 [Sphaerobolus stellatus SS14]